MATPPRLTTTPKALPPTFAIAKMGSQHLQASDAMALWMQTITNQAAAAIAQLPADNVTHTGPALPANLVVLGSGSSQVKVLADPGVPDEVLVSAGPGQEPRWRTLEEIRPPIVPALGQPPPDLSTQQQTIINQIVGLLYELVRMTKAG